jgi:hypothetical protein
MSCCTSILFQGESVANVVEGDGQVLRAAQRRELTIGWRVGDQAWIDEPTSALNASCVSMRAKGAPPET